MRRPRRPSAAIDLTGADRRHGARRVLRRLLAAPGRRRTGATYPGLRLLSPEQLEVAMRAECEGDFDVSLEAGFAYITDPANWPDYWPGFVRIEPGSRWGAPGDEAQIVTRLLGREVALRMRLLRFEPNRLVEYESTQDGLPDARHERRFDATDGGFRYRLVVDYEPRSALRGVFDRIVVRRGVERALRRTVANLERALPR